uniref:Uncharacterized protein n=1 Tax=Panagrolaimus sp. JU765 TaxID=591449 RepID=A0AC34QNP1_9BILA
MATPACPFLILDGTKYLNGYGKAATSGGNSSHFVSCKKIKSASQLDKTSTPFFLHTARSPATFQQKIFNVLPKTSKKYLKTIIHIYILEQKNSPQINTVESIKIKNGTNIQKQIECDNNIKRKKT